MTVAISKRPRITPGIVCAEGYWRQRALSRGSLASSLRRFQSRFPVYHNFPVTYIQLLDAIEAWVEDSLRLSVLCLLFHGAPGELLIGDRPFSLNRLGRQLARRARGRIIHFGSCETLAVSDSVLKKFFARSGAAIVSGYESEVSFMDAELIETDLLRFFMSLDEKSIRDLKLCDCPRRLRPFLRFAKDFSF